MNEKSEKILLDEKGFFFLLGLFVFLNWLTAVNIEKLTHPDYYQYYAASEKLFSGNLKLQFIPPLFPFLLGLSGRFLGLFLKNTDNFILGGRIISLLAGSGVVYFTYRLLGIFIGNYAKIGTIALVILPFFLKLLSIPQTDMLYLFFVCAACYFFTIEKSKWNVAWVLIGGLLTRFEGILLIGSAYLNYFRVKKRRWLYFVLPVVPLVAGLYFLFLNFAPRIIEKFTYVFSSGYYLYFFKHPQELVHLFYGNFLYFISPGFPAFLKWILFYILLAFFVAGFYFLFKLNRPLALAILAYELVFIVFKGYAASLDPEIEFRRMLSAIWIFYVAAVIGIYFLFKKINKTKKFSFIARAALYCFLVTAAFSRPMIKGTWLFLFLILIPALLYGTCRLNLNKIELTTLFLVLLLSCGQFYFDSGKRVFRYVKHNTNEAGFVIGQWLKSGAVIGSVQVYSYIPMVKYYMGKSKRVKIEHFVFLNEKIYRNRNKLLFSLLRKAQRAHVKYIVFDGYLNPEEGDFRVAIYKMLYQEKEKLHRGGPEAKDSYFKLFKTFTYKGEPVAWVLKPLYEKLPKKKEGNKAAEMDRRSLPFT